MPVRDEQTQRTHENLIDLLAARMKAELKPRYQGYYGNLVLSSEELEQLGELKDVRRAGREAGRRLGWKAKTHLSNGRLFIYDDRDVPEEVAQVAGRDAAEATVAFLQGVQTEQRARTSRTPVARKHRGPGASQGGSSSPATSSAPGTPDATHHLVCGGVPVGFGAPVYASPLSLRRPGQQDQLMGAWPSRPPGARTSQQLRTSGLRPANLFRPDGYVLGDPVRVHPLERGYEDKRDPDGWAVHPASPLYLESEAVPLGTAPDTHRIAADRQESADWAMEVLSDPKAVILTVSTLGLPPRETDYPHEASTVCEIALTDAAGKEIWHQIIDPQWGEVPEKDLEPLGLTQAQLDEAPVFSRIRAHLEQLLKGRRVVVYGRSRTYAALFYDYVYAATGACFPDGWVGLDHLDVIKTLRRSEWECARLRHAEFRGEWDGTSGHYVLPPGPSEGTCLDRCRSVVDVLRRMAAPARYRELNERAQLATNEGRSHKARPVRGTRLSRAAAAKQAVLERSDGACENPRCSNPRYTSDRTHAGAYLLEVDHVDDHAKGGADLPSAMIALCPNCHTVKTLGTTGESLRELFREVARERHRRMLGSPDAPASVS
ncbi:HNH endonuclease signature motif containing protein [Streptomyces klenkii]|uniref:HNH endonuclease n=1 Tax=Streptomyces klenkii TaxID=1420899 RepID=UPI0033BCE1A3